MAIRGLRKPEACYSIRQQWQQANFWLHEQTELTNCCFFSPFTSTVSPTL